MLKFLDRVHVENGTKSQRQIADGMHLKARSRVNDLLCGRALPADERQVDALVRALGGGDDEVGRAIRLYRAAAADRDKRSVPAALRREPARQRPPAVDAWSPFHLGVHRAITVDLIGGTALPDLPLYAVRDLDHELDDLLEHVVNNVMIVLVGGSSTGKTRAAYEAIRRNLDDWSLVHPATRDELLALLASDALGPRTIVWLNETQSYLQDDGRVAASLRRLLASADRGPIVVIGSMWSTYWKELTDDKHRDSDRHHQARELLLHAVRRVTVPEAFSSKDLAALREQQAADPRLTVASERCGSSGRVIQVLAGGPALVQRFEEPADAEDRYGRAVVSAAMDCRVLGQHGPITGAYLAEVAAAYLSPEDRASALADWFDIGLAHAIRTIHGIAALTPHRDLLTAGPADGYLLHDYLFQHAQQAPRAVVPAPVWDGLVTYASVVADRASLALEADERQLLHHALELAFPASEVGDDDAMWLVAATLATAGFVDEAEERWKRIVASGHPDGLGGYVEFLDDQDRDDDALMVLLDAAEAGDVGAMAMLGYRLSHGLESLWEGSAEAAEHWLRRAGEAGVLDAWLNLADLLERHGDVDAAESAMFSALMTRPKGNTRAIRFLAEWLTARERPDAERWSRMADRREESGARRALSGQLRPEEADDGLLLMTLTDARTIWRMVERLASKGERVEADRLLRHAILTGELGNVGHLVDKMQETGRGDEVEEWLRSGLSSGNPAVITCLSNLLRDSGRPDEAIQILRDATAFVDGPASWMLAGHLELAGRTDEAEQIWRRLIGRQPSAIPMLIQLLEKTGRVEEANYLTSTLPDHVDNDELIAERVEQLVTAGQVDEAEQWLRRRTEDGASAASIQLAWFLREHGRTEEADRYIRFGIEPGGQTAAPWSPPDPLTQ